MVTGASRGIGAAIASRLTQAGFLVIGTATSESGAESISQFLGDQGIGMPLRLQDSDSITAAMKHVAELGRSIDVLVNNAGMTRDTLLLRMSDAMWTEVVEANLNGMFRVTKAVLRGMMKNRWGRIINLSSVVARSGNPGQANYAASKAGIEGFTRAMAQEVASRNITVNCVAPGFIETDMTAGLPESVQEEFKSRIPMGRMGTADDVAGVVEFLVSDQANYITAQTIGVNGGLLAN